MRRIVAAINMTIDGYADHTAVTPDEEVHEHYSELLSNADAILYGRITYQLMEYWLTVLENPTGNAAMDEFALVIDRIPKVVFSNTLKSVDWKGTRIASRDLKDEVTDLRQQPGKDILVGSPSIIISLMNHQLIDELQLCVHPVLAAGGMPLFKNIRERTVLKLLRTKTFKGGAVVFYYEPGMEG
ncbi:MAG TPA: dihydrofolate reductase family protein [Bacteroidales bacterium]|nr:dihydrofolate reductase family protein [Bacteroidales bacterium]